MAANTKYQPAPQRDSFEEHGSYSQAPPSYQQENPRSTLLGEPRSEYDNVPDDFKVSFQHIRLQER
jgi:protein lifeguard